MRQRTTIIAAIALLAGGGAHAQSSVSFYGLINASIETVDNGDTAAANGVRNTKVSSNSSRIGFRGSEDLGNGAMALFQIETAFNTDGTVAGNLAVRNTFVGLSSKRWGQALAGNYDSPYKTAIGGLDFFPDTLGDNRNLLGKGASTFGPRLGNAVRYDSIDIGGFRFAAAWAAGAEGATLGTDQKGKALSLSAARAFGKAWNATLAHERHDFGTAGTGTFGAPAGFAAGDAERAWRLGLAYREGAIRASLIVERSSDDFALAASREHTAWSLGGGYTVGANEFKLAYAMADDADGTSNTGAKQWVVGMDHALSKRTALYALYVSLDNESAQGYGLTGAGGSTTGITPALGLGADPSAWQFGVRHSF